MDIGVIGVNHKSADLNFREKLAKNFQRNEVRNFLHSFAKVILFTCNRFEVYFHSPNLTRAHSSLLHDFTQEFNLTSSYKLYSYFGKDCFFHLSKVTSGIDSAVLAETEIQGQVKKAYLDAQDRCNKELHFLFQKSLKIGKKMRQELKIGSDIPNLISTTLDVIQEKVKGKKLLFIGASETNYKIIKRLKVNNFQISLSNRTDAKGALMADELGIDYLNWKSLNYWNGFDGIICATNCPYYLLTGKDKILKPKLILDLSVPRDVDPKIGQHDLVQLFNIDQMNKMVRKNRKLELPHISALSQKVYSQVCTQHNIFINKDAKLESLQVI